MSKVGKGFVLAFACTITAAQADWSESTVAYQCDQQAGTFALRGAVVANDETYIPVLPGYTVISDEHSTTLSCAIGHANVTAKIKVIPPRERGMCAAHTVYDIESLTVNGRTILTHEQFNFICSPYPSLYKFDISVHPKDVRVDSCKGTWEWEREYRESKCESQLFPLN